MKMKKNFFNQLYSAEKKMYSSVHCGLVHVLVRSICRFENTFVMNFRFAFLILSFLQFHFLLSILSMAMWFSDLPRPLLLLMPLFIIIIIIHFGCTNESRKFSIQKKRKKERKTLTHSTKCGAACAHQLFQLTGICSHKVYSAISHECKLLWF